MKNCFKILIAVLLFLVVGYSAGAHSVTLKFQTQTTRGRYAPEHVLAVWIQDSEGNFVKSLKVMARRYTRFLTGWRLASGGNTVDAVTGPTMFSHQNHVLDWDCTDKEGNQVPDGDYKVLIEFSEVNGDGPIYSFNFKVSSENLEFEPDDKPYVKNIAINVNPE